MTDFYFSKNVLLVQFTLYLSFQNERFFGTRRCILKKKIKKGGPPACLGIHFSSTGRLLPSRFQGNSQVDDGRKGASAHWRWRARACCAWADHCAACTLRECVHMHLMSQRSASSHLVSSLLDCRIDISHSVHANSGWRQHGRHWWRQQFPFHTFVYTCEYSYYTA